MAFLNEVFSGRRETVTVSGLTEAISGFIRREKVRRRTLAELSALSDRELTDLNISRYDIRRIAAEVARDA